MPSERVVSGKIRGVDMMGFEVSYCHLVRPSLVNAHTLVCFCVCVGGVVL